MWYICGIVCVYDVCARMCVVCVTCVCVCALCSVCVCVHSSSLERGPVGTALARCQEGGSERCPG